MDDEPAFVETEEIEPSTDEMVAILRGAIAAANEAAERSLRSEVNDPSRFAELLPIRNMRWALALQVLADEFRVESQGAQ